MSAFEDWLQTALPGDRFTYFTGTLANARVRQKLTDEETQMAGDALVAAEAGLVHLVQRRREIAGIRKDAESSLRHPYYNFDYIAIRAEMMKK